MNQFSMVHKQDQITTLSMLATISDHPSEDSKLCCSYLKAHVLLIEIKILILTLSNYKAYRIAPICFFASQGVHENIQSEKTKHKNTKKLLRKHI